jgi:hypothetical protein
MAVSWFRYNGPTFDGDPVINPLNFTIFGGTPPQTTTGTSLAYIFATIQLISNVRRPIISPVSPTGTATSTEIHGALTTGISTPNVLLTNSI